MVNKYANDIGTFIKIKLDFERSNCEKRSFGN